MKKDYALVDAADLMGGIVCVLETDPQLYKRFGVFWWDVKRELRVHGYRPRLSILGHYEDPATTRLVAEGRLAEMLHGAVLEFGTNSINPRADGRTSTPAGDLVDIIDLDAKAN